MKKITSSSTISNVYFAFSVSSFSKTTTKKIIPREEAKNNISLRLVAQTCQHFRERERKRKKFSVCDMCRKIISKKLTGRR